MCEERQCLYKFYLCFIRIFAPKCAACGEGITPVEGTSDTVRVVAMEKDFHVDCYVCEVGNFLVRNSLTQNRIITKKSSDSFKNVTRGGTKNYRMIKTPRK